MKSDAEIEQGTNANKKPCFYAGSDNYFLAITAN